MYTQSVNNFNLNRLIELSLLSNNDINYPIKYLEFNNPLIKSFKSLFLNASGNSGIGISAILYEDISKYSLLSIIIVSCTSLIWLIILLCVLSKNTSLYYNNDMFSQVAWKSFKILLH